MDRSGALSGRYSTVNATGFMHPRDPNARLSSSASSVSGGAGKPHQSAAAAAASGGVYGAHHHAEDPAVQYMASRAPQASAVTSLQFAGLQMQLEVERSKREDGDRQLREEFTVQMHEMREALRSVSRDNAALRENVNDLRRDASAGSRRAGGGADGSIFGASDAAAPTGPGSARGQWEALIHRVDTVEGRVDRHQRVLEERHTRMESAVSEFCSAHLGVETDKLRSVAREAARNSVDVLFEEKTKSLMASWADSFSDLQTQVATIAQRTRDTVASVKERVDSADGAISLVKADAEHALEQLRGMGETRTLVASITSLRAEHERHVTQFREQTNDWQRTEGALTAEISAVKDLINDAKSSVSSALGKRIDTVASGCVSRTDLMAAIERHANSTELDLRELATAITAVKSAVGSIRETTESRAKTVDAALRRTGEDATAGVDELREALTHLKTSVDQRLANIPAASSLKQASTEIEVRLSQRLATAEATAQETARELHAAQAELNAMQVQLDSMSNSLRDRVIDVEQANTAMRRIVADVQSDNQTTSDALSRVETLVDAERIKVQRAESKASEASQRVETVENRLEARLEDVTVTARAAEQAAADAKAAARQHATEAREGVVAAASDVARQVAKAELSLAASSTATARPSARDTSAAEGEGLREADVRRIANAAVRDAAADIRRDVTSILDDEMTSIRGQVEGLATEVRRTRKAASDDARAASEKVALEAATSIDSVNDAHTAFKKHVDTTVGQLTSHVDALERRFGNAEARLEDVSSSATASTEAARPSAASSDDKVDLKEYRAFCASVRAEVSSLRDQVATMNDPDQEQPASAGATTDQQAELRVVKHDVQQLRKDMAELRNIVDVPAVEADTGDESEDAASRSSVTAFVMSRVAQVESGVNAAVTRQTRNAAATTDSRLADMSAQSAGIADDVDAMQRAVDEVTKLANSTRMSVEQLRGRVDEQAFQLRTVDESVVNMKDAIEALPPPPAEAAATTEADVERMVNEAFAKLPPPPPPPTDGGAAAPGGAIDASAVNKLIDDRVQERFTDIELDLQVWQSKAKELSDRIDTLSREASDAAANAASSAFERYRSEVVNLQQSLSGVSSAESPGSQRRSRNNDSTRGDGSSPSDDDVAAWRERVDTFSERVVVEINDIVEEIKATRIHMNELTQLQRTCDGRVNEFDQELGEQRQVMDRLNAEVGDAVGRVFQGISACIETHREMDFGFTDHDGNALPDIPEDEQDLAAASGALWHILSGTAWEVRAVANSVLSLRDRLAGAGVLKVHEDDDTPAGAVDSAPDSGSTSGPGATRSAPPIDRQGDMGGGGGDADEDYYEDFDDDF